MHAVRSLGTRYAVVCLALLITVLLAYLVAHATGQVMEDEQVASYQREMADVAVRVQERLITAEEAVTAVAQVGWPGRLEWRKQAAQIRTQRAIPGMTGTAFVRRVKADESVDYEARVKTDVHVHPQGHANFLIFPVGSRDEYYVVHDYEPWTGNLAAVGFDMGADPAARQMLNQAGDSGRLSALDRSSEALRTKGFFLAAPVYDRALPQHTPAERQQALIGFVVGIYETAPLMESAVQGLRMPHLSLEVEEVGQRGPFTAYDPDPHHDARSGAGSHKRVQEIQLWNRTWRLHTDMIPSEISAMRQSVERRVFAGSIAVGLILCALLWYYIDGRDRALRRVAQVTRELKDSQQRFAETFGPSAVGMAMVATDWRFLQVNASYCSLVGYSEEELRTLRATDITHPDDLEHALMLPETLRRGEVAHVRVEQRFVHKNGTPVWCQLTLTRAHDSGGDTEYFIAQAEDLTAKRQAEESARQQAQLYRMLAENTSDLVSLYGMDGTCVYVSPSCQSILGCTQQAFQHADLLSLVCERDRPIVLHAVNEALAGGSPRITCQIQKFSGDYIWLETDLRPVLGRDGVPVQLQCCARDVTVRKQAEEQVVRYSDEVEWRHRQLDSLVRSMAEGVIAVDESELLLLMNAEASRLLGAASMPLGRSIRTLPLPTPLVEALSLAAQGQRSDDRLALRMGDLDMTVSVAPVVTSDGRIAGAVATLQDVTAQAQINRMRESFVASASHELRGPLAALSAVIEAMRDGMIPVEAYPKYHTQALGEIHRLRRLTDDLMLLSQLKSGLAEVTPVDFDLRSLLQGLHDRWAHRCAASGVQLTYECPELWVRADCDRTEQVLVAFLDNALRYTPPGGQIRLFAEEQENGVRLGVEDSGSGIAPEHLSLIWERFYKVDPARSHKGGSGLGLAIVREVAARMHGSVQVQSEVGRGSVFSLCLPDVLITSTPH